MQRGELIKTRVSELPIISEVAHRLISVINEPEAGEREIANVIMIDPILTANVLKTANSVFYRSVGEIDNLLMAVKRLGIRQVFKIAMATIMRSFLDRPAMGYEMSAKELWLHANAVASVAGTICDKVKYGKCGFLYTSALIHDIGKIVLGEMVSNELEEIWRVSEAEDIPFEQAEQRVLGFDHAQVGAEIAERWNFPQKIVSIIRWHHNPEQAPEIDRPLDIVHVADALCLQQGLGIGNDGLRYLLNESSIVRLGLTSDDLDASMCNAAQFLVEFEQMYGSTHEKAEARR